MRLGRRLGAPQTPQARIPGVTTDYDSMRFASHDSLLEAGEVPQPDAPPTTRETPGGKLIGRAGPFSCVPRIQSDGCDTRRGPPLCRTRTPRSKAAPGTQSAATGRLQTGYGE